MSYYKIHTRKSRHLIKRVPFMQLSIFLYYPARRAIRNIMQINNLEIKFPSTEGVRLSIASPTYMCIMCTRCRHRL